MSGNDEIWVPRVNTDIENLKKELEERKAKEIIIINAINNQGGRIEAIEMKIAACNILIVVIAILIIMNSVYKSL